ncbi:MAG: DEAD/DEAH box helicase [Gammaproteobacteria bacterium]|nr:DEAD/DEAH box helicase [Gammaproteobacteria bacterium]
MQTLPLLEKVSHYEALKKNDREIVDFLAVSWTALSEARIKAALLRPVARPLNLKNMVAQGLLLKRQQAEGGEGFACHPLLVDVVARRLVAEGLYEAFVEKARGAWPLPRTSGKSGPRTAPFWFEHPDQFTREIRMALYLNDPHQMQTLFEAFYLDSGRYWGSHWDEIRHPSVIGAEAALNPFDPVWLEGVAPEMRRDIAARMLTVSIEKGTLDASVFEALERHCLELQRYSMELVLGALLFGQRDKALEYLPLFQGLDHERMALEGLLAYLNQEDDKAIKRFDEALRWMRKNLGERRLVLPGLLGVFHIGFLLLRNEGKDFARAKALLSDADLWYSEMGPTLKPLHWTLLLEDNPSTHLPGYLKTVLASASKPDPAFWPVFLGLLFLYRYQGDPETFQPLAEAIGRLEAGLEASGMRWPQAEMALLRARFEPHSAETQKKAENLRERLGYALLTQRVRYEEPWELKLNAIVNRFGAKGTKEAASLKAPKEARLAWFVFRDFPRYGIEIREQKQNRQGWTKGKPIALRTFKETGESKSHLDAQDQRAIAAITQDSFGRGYHLSDQGWLDLEGHPALFWRDSAQPLELRLEPPHLKVRAAGKDRVKIEFWPHDLYRQSMVFTLEGLHRLNMTPMTTELHRLSELIGSGFDAPLRSHEKVLEKLGAVSGLVAIHSEIGGGEVLGAEVVTAESVLRIQLIREGEGLKAQALVRPFGQLGPSYAPGVGGVGLMATVDGRRLQTERDLRRERDHLKQLRTVCVSLEDTEAADHSDQWTLLDPEASLQFLLELQTLAEDVAVPEWPKGQSLKLVGEARLASFQVKLTQQRDWFSVQGELKLDHGEVLMMQKLLELTADTKGRFIQLEGDRFLALTDDFRKRLEDLRAYSETHGSGRRVHPLALSALDDIKDEFGAFETDKAFKQQIDQLRRSEVLRPNVPSTLVAELRDYQFEGFVWLSRLAAWGVGGCLADDMGLGKTVQAIALILSRAQDGPSLVIAPTSVVFNWHNEVARFAPTLRLKTLTGDREEVIQGLEPMDLLVVSYALLQQEVLGAALAEVRFRTLVLDEAQAIKNAATRRSQQAMAMQADFKLITTGTPLENHLGELWNLFRFINPGLLGSLESFNRRFQGPIERSQSKEARHRLKRLIQPFILRRTKVQVLEELPERTDIELMVDLSPDEANLYEALRRKLLSELEQTDGPIQDHRFRVLAAITKLRRACCHPNLVAPELALTSSKLTLLGEVLEDLLDNKHKALIFSQFVDHLRLVEAMLQKEGIAYQYLDGQTPQKDRKRAVEAFQGGDGDVFLISLKAGGTGLNLTAADYVIHLDPWWNPAVEDQASARAHRMGQKRPVTIYRLIAKGTIEEQIVSLHRHKRELADSLLDGGEMSAKVGADELLELMRSGLEEP